MQTVPHAPQLALSVCSSTHTPKQAVLSAQLAASTPASFDVDDPLAVVPLTLLADAVVPVTETPDPVALVTETPDPLALVTETSDPLALVTVTPDSLPLEELALTVPVVVSVMTVVPPVEFVEVITVVPVVTLAPPDPVAFEAVPDAPLELFTLPSRPVVPPEPPSSGPRSSVWVLPPHEATSKKREPMKMEEAVERSWRRIR